MAAPYYLIDGSGYIFRAYHALPPMTRPDGTPVNAVYGFCSMLMKLHTDLRAENMLVVFDAGKRTFRNDLYAEYKAHRPPAPEDLIPQFPLIRQAVEAFGIAQIEVPNYEADDLIATYCRQLTEQENQAIIVSADKDLTQLMNPHVQLFDPIKNKMLEEEDVLKKFGVPSDKVIEVQALAGDSADNIPGVPGIGVKTAAELITTFGDLETLLAEAHTIKQPKRRERLIEHADQARLSLELVRLADQVPDAPALESFAAPALDPQRLQNFFQENGFRALLKRLPSLHDAPAVAHTDAAPVLAEAATPVQGSLFGDMAPTPAQPTSTDYKLVTTIEDLAAWCQRIAEQGYVALDTETTGLDAMQVDLVGISLSLTAGEACYIPLAHQTETPQLSLSEVQEHLGPLLQDDSVLKIGHNIKYDALILTRHGLPLTTMTDTMLLSYVIYNAQHPHGLDELALRYLDHQCISYGEVTGKGKNKKTFDQVALEEACAYACEDADITLRLYHLLQKDLTDQHQATVYETLERPLIPVLMAMEKEGICLDQTKLQQLSQDFEQGLKMLEEQIFATAGTDTFNIASPKQLGTVLFETLGLPGGKKNKTGGFSTSSEVLEPLAASHPIAQMILDWRQLAKLKSTYTDALQKQMHPETHRVHTSYAQAITNTGRLSSSAPNLQNIPIRTPEGRQIRQAFIAKPGYRLVSLDYSQIELRLLAHCADVPTLQQAFAEGQDIHALTASQVFGMPLAEVSAENRRRAKAINFGIIYGISPFGLANQLGCPQDQAKAYIAAYFAQYPGIKDYMEDTIALCRRQGYVQTVFGRRCYIREIQDKNPNRRNFAERAAINAPLQGSAADIIKRAMIRVPKALAAFEASLLLQVHDELIFECREDQTDSLITQLRPLMESAPQPAVSLKVPLVVEGGSGRTWGEAH